jgi:hypothetical protein
MKPYWRLNPIDFEALKKGLHEINQWADTIATETVMIVNGYDVPRGHVLDEAPNGFGLKPFGYVAAQCGHSHERAVALLGRIS